jgi:hypothetical protein
VCPPPPSCPCSHRDESSRGRPSTLPPAKKVPTVVLTSDEPIDFLGTGDAPRYHPHWVEAQTLLARSLSGKQITNTDSGHFIQNENPMLVIDQTKTVLTAARARSGAGS